MGKRRVWTFEVVMTRSWDGTGCKRAMRATTGFFSPPVGSAALITHPNTVEALIRKQNHTIVLTIAFSRVIPALVVKTTYFLSRTTV